MSAQVAVEVGTEIYRILFDVGIQAIGAQHSSDLHELVIVVVALEKRVL